MMEGETNLTDINCSTLTFLIILSIHYPKRKCREIYVSYAKFCSPSNPVGGYL